MIHVAYRLWGGDGFFAKMLGTSMLSMFENTKEKVTVHIMHNDRLTPDNRDKFCYIAGQYNQHVEFHNVEKIAGATLRKFEAAYPMSSGINAAWYPLIIHEVFPNLDKLIFMGADTVFYLTDISDLWNIELNEEFPFGAVAEFAKWGQAYGAANLCYDGIVGHTDYFNADLFLLKPSFFRDNFELVLETCKKLYKTKYFLAEQDLLNYLFSKKYQKLPNRFNLCLNWERELGKRPLKLEKAIYHYAAAKPDLNTDDIYNQLYFEYFMKTPWANTDMFGNIGKYVHGLYNRSQDNLLHFTTLLTQRKRAFFIDKNYVEPTKNIFKVKDDEQIITLQEGGDKFIEEITASKGEKIFFILIGKDNYRTARIILLSRGFVEGFDFVDASIFLSERYGLESDFIHISRKLASEL